MHGRDDRSNESREGLPQLRRHQKHGWLAGFGLSLRRFDEPLLQAFGQPRFQPGTCGVALYQRARKQLLEIGLKRNHRKFVGIADDVLDNLTAERDSHLALQSRGVLRARRVLGNRFDDRAHVANRHAFGQQPLQNSNDHAERQHFRHQVFDEFRRRLRQVIEEMLHFFMAQQLMGMRLHDMA